MLFDLEIYTRVLLDNTTLNWFANKFRLVADVAVQRTDDLTLALGASALSRRRPITIWSPNITDMSWLPILHSFSACAGDLITGTLTGRLQLHKINSKMSRVLSFNVPWQLHCCSIMQFVLLYVIMIIVKCKHSFFTLRQHGLLYKALY